MESSTQSSFCSTGIQIHLCEKSWNSSSLSYFPEDFPGCSVQQACSVRRNARPGFSLELTAQAASRGSNIPCVECFASYGHLICVQGMGCWKSSSSLLSSPKKGVVKEISALKLRFCRILRWPRAVCWEDVPRGWLGVCSLWFSSAFQFSSSSLQHLAELGRAGKGLERLGKAGKGSFTCPAGVWVQVSLLKQLDLLREPKFLHFFFGSCSQQSVIYLFIDWLSSPCWWCFPSGKTPSGNSNSSFLETTIFDPGKFLQLPEALRGWIKALDS